MRCGTAKRTSTASAGPCRTVKARSTLVIAGTRWHTARSHRGAGEPVMLSLDARRCASNHAQRSSRASAKVQTSFSLSKCAKATCGGSRLRSSVGHSRRTWSPPKRRAETQTWSSDHSSAEDTRKVRDWTPATRRPGGSRDAQRRRRAGHELWQEVASGPGKQSRVIRKCNWHSAAAVARSHDAAGPAGFRVPAMA